ncbi:HEPN domain-containing protein [Filimonas effusa]|uniref:HEPN domain-containing protein n=1 Tax=Filimonas effusa TaxID=2508721 RepID=A0A4Q1D9E1_9BACT|nr:hypothetical protein [Filimonas effusa]RXK85315.1 hypothetical protein ESB13_00370 [Filimonas effusa]
MQNTFDFLSSTERQRLKELADAIAKAVFPEKIICYGYKRLNVQRWQVFSGAQMLKDEIAFDILIIKGKTNPFKDEDVLTLLDKIRLPHVRANYIIHRVTGVNAAISEGSHFFNLVSKYGWMVLDSGAPLHSYQYDCSLYRCINLAKEVWTLVYPRAFGFYKGAEYYKGAGNWELEAFLLHQAVEQTALALVKAVTGYRPLSHNISRLAPLLDLAGLDCSVFFR